MTDRDTQARELREVRDEDTGRFIGRLNPRTLEFTRPERGRVLRARLTDYLATKSATGSAGDEKLQIP